MAIFVVVAFGTGYLATQSVTIALAPAALAYTMMAPRFVIIFSTFWVILCRPGFELIKTTVGGVLLTEVDALIVLSIIAGSVILVTRSPGMHEYRVYIPLALGWPAFLIFRLIEPATDTFKFISPFLDLRLLTAYAMALPALLLVREMGRERAIRGLVLLGYIACTVGIVGWILCNSGIIGLGQNSFWSITANPLVSRPGGEILIPIVICFAILNPQLGQLKNRYISSALIIGAVLASQTLSLVAASVAAVMVGIVISRKQVPFVRKFVVVGALAVILLVFSGVLGSESRFNLDARVDENSAQYRVEEVDTIFSKFAGDPFLVAIGSGPGSVVNFSGKVISVEKRDTHNVYISIYLKTGLIGVLLFLTPFAYGMWRGLRCQSLTGRSAGVSVLAVLVLSISVPFAWTVSGLTVLLLLSALCVTGLQETHSIGSRLPVRTEKSTASLSSRA
ncbi:hypothetical protein BJI47_14685 [Rhodococcus sp. 1168]|nr:hypothetical protein BJI47_14685 [Rhodococcus sp. 1168]